MIARIAAVAAVTFFGLFGVMSPPAVAQASIDDLGWWSQRPGAAAQPDGGFELALAPNGPTSVAALRITVDVPVLTGAMLELTETDAVGAEFAAIDVCPSQNSWRAANPGAWDAAPTWNCTRRVPLSRRASGEWAGDISELLDTGTRSIALVPASHAETQGLPLPYQLTFSGASLSPEVPAESEDAPSPSTFEDIVPPGQIEDDTPTEPVPADDGPSDPAPVVTPPDDDGDTRDVAAEDEFEPLTDSDDDPGPPKAWWRLAILTPVAASLGALAVFARKTATDRGWTG